MTARFTDCCLGNMSVELPIDGIVIGDESHLEVLKSRVEEVAVSKVTSGGLGLKSALIFRTSPRLLGDHSALMLGRERPLVVNPMNVAKVLAAVSEAQAPCCPFGTIYTVVGGGSLSK